MKISYADSFNDNVNNRNTFAYPTKLTDPANNFSEVKYRFDIGANVQAKSPAPAGNANGKETVRLFDALGRLTKQTISNTGAYTRYEYPANGVQSKIYSTVVDTNNNGADSNDEVLSESWADGAGRVRKSRRGLPNSTGGYSGQIIEYDILGQIKQQSVPTEINTDWEPSGNDAARGWLWSSQEYDWKGRVIRQVNIDGTDKLFTFEGCGCAGGQVTTVKGEQLQEGRRTQKIYQDILSRSYKTQILNWDGSVYATKVSTYNGRDQVTLSREYEGTESSNTFQDSIFGYDGLGRLKNEHRPEMDAGAVTTFEYFADNSLASKLDVRGAKTNYTYDNRGLLINIGYFNSSSTILTPTSTSSYGYDSVGNRTWMEDGFGRMDYEYDELSRLTAETRQFHSSLTDAPSSANGFRMSYLYQLGGGLKSVSYPNQITINYGLDATGAIKNISGSSEGQPLSILTNVDYRAWGAVKKAEFGNGTYSQLTYNNRLLPTTENFIGREFYQGSYETKPFVDNQYSYYADGSLILIDDKLPPQTNLGYNYYNRLQKYDVMGNLTTERSGSEAKGNANLNHFIKYGYDFK